MTIVNRECLKVPKSEEEIEASLYPPLKGFLWVYWPGPAPFQRGLCSPKDISISESSLWEENLFVDISGSWSFFLYPLATPLWAFTHGGRGGPGRCPSAGHSQFREINTHINNSTIGWHECWGEKDSFCLGKSWGSFGACPWRWLEFWKVTKWGKGSSSKSEARSLEQSMCSQWSERVSAVRNGEGL